MLMTAENGVDALRLTVDGSPDIVVLDSMTPGLSGLEVCAARRAHPDARAPRVLMLTARAQESDLQAAYEAGVDGWFLIEPFRPEEAQERVAALLARA